MTALAPRTSHMMPPMIRWFRSFSDPLASASNAARWIGQLPTVDAASLQKEALELVSSFPGARKDAGPGQVEALLRIDGRVEPIIAQLTQQYTQNYQKSTNIESRLWHSVFDLVKAFIGGLPDRAQGRLSACRPQALARDPAVGDRAPRALPRARRQVPSLPLQPLDSRAVARIPRAVRIRADARLAARAARLRRRRVCQARRVVRAGIPEDACC